MCGHDTGTCHGGKTCVGRSNGRCSRLGTRGSRAPGRPANARPGLHGLRPDHSGFALLLLSVFATLIVFLTLSSMSRFEYVLGMKNLRDLMLEVPAGNLHSLTSILRLLMEHGITIRSIKTEDAPEHDRKIVRMKVSVPRRSAERTVSMLLADHADVTQFEWL